MSLSRIFDSLKQGFAEPKATQPQHDPLRLATAAVLLEIGYADGEFTPAEDGDLVGFLQRAF